MRQHQVFAPGSDLIEARLAKFSFDVILIDEAVPAMRVETNVGGLPARFAGQQPCHIPLRAASRVRIEKCGSAISHHVRSTNRRVSPGQRKLNSLIPAERRSKHL